MDAHLEKSNGFGTALRHNQCILGVPRERQCHDDEELDGPNQEKLLNLVFSMNGKECTTGVLPRKG